MESARPALCEQPTHECRRPVGCVPHVVIHPQYLEILHGRTDSLEGRRSLTRLFYWNRPVDLAVDDPRRHAPQLTSQSLEGWAAIRGTTGVNGRAVGKNAVTKPQIGTRAAKRDG